MCKGFQRQIVGANRHDQVLRHRRHTQRHDCEVARGVEDHVVKRRSQGEDAVRETPLGPANVAQGRVDAGQGGRTRDEMKVGNAGNLANTITGTPLVQEQLDD